VRLVNVVIVADATPIHIRDALWDHYRERRTEQQPCAPQLELTQAMTRELERQWHRAHNIGAGGQRTAHGQQPHTVVHGRGTGVKGDRPRRD